MKIYLSLLFFCFLFVAQAQVDKTQALAKQYYQTGDYEKASQLFEELWKDSPDNYYYYSSLFNAYLRLNDYENAENVVKKQIKKNKDNPSFLIDLGFVYSQNNNSNAAEKEYKEVLNNLSADVNMIRSIASKFMGVSQNDFAIETYLKGRDLLKDKTLFGFELGNAYLIENKPKEAVQAYLALMESNPNYQKSVENVLSNNIEKEGIQDELESQLYTLVQKNPNQTQYAELLIWLFTHQADYEQALIQAKALDKRNQEQGGRIIILADNALQEKQYDAAISGYQYIQSKGEFNRFYQIAKSNEIKAKKLKVTTTQNYTDEDLAALNESYRVFIDAFGLNENTVEPQRELANLQAYYLKDIDKAIASLEAVLAIPNLKKKVKNEVKLDLGDYYILAGDVWEATLYYAQVDKDEKDSPLGEDARYRNAKLSYYKGEFAWAQAQLGILKGATTELIANNALELSVFILDNLGLDTTTATMQLYADAELLHKQNKDDQALRTLDKILSDFPGHPLSDDVLFQKAKILFENRDFVGASKLLDGILENYGEDILADNAAFMLGDIYQNYLNQPEKAMAYYKRIITDYSGSVLLVEARKRFRFLRGDGV